MATYREPYDWWGPDDPRTLYQGLSVIELVEKGTLDLPLASLLWLGVEHKASIIVAAKPRRAGKTVLLTALSHLIPPAFDLVFTHGEEEDFAFLLDTDPARTYILCNEISDHLPAYLWGQKVLTLFEALPRGYSLGTTMHADFPDEVVRELEGPSLRVHPRLVTGLTFIVVLAMVERPEGVLRRVRQVTLVDSGDRSRLPYILRPVSRWDPATDTFTVDLSPPAQEAVKRRLGLADDLVEALIQRGRVLATWMADGLRTPQAVREKVLDYYGRAPLPSHTVR